jgi:AcrR family transcriptional regulator
MVRARERVQDGRVRKTQGRLRDALVSLIHEKSYATIVVKEILDRADVGRTAFYAHFRDKDALLASGIHHVLHRNAASSPSSAGGRLRRALWFSLPVFEHVEQFRHGDGAHMDRRGHAIVHQHLRKVLIDQVADEIRATVPPTDTRAGRAPTDLLVEYVVATFILVLNWWVESRSPLSPRQIDDLFLTLVVPTLTAATETA